LFGTDDNLPFTSKIQERKDDPMGSDALSDAEYTALAYAFLLERLELVWLCHTTAKKDPLRSLFQYLKSQISTALGVPLTLAYPDESCHQLHRTRVLLRAVINCAANGLSDAKIDGNGRTAALLYAIYGRRPEQTQSDLEASPEGLVWGEEMSISDTWWSYNLTVDVVSPTAWDKVESDTQKMGRDTEIERTSGEDWYVLEFVKLYLTQLLDPNVTPREELIERYTPREFDYEPTPTDPSVLQRCYLRDSNQLLRSEATRNKVGQELDYLFQTVMSTRIPKELLKEVTAFDVEGKRRRFYIGAIASTVWTTPKRYNTLFSLVLTMFARYAIIDSTQRKDQPRDYRFLFNLLSLANNNGTTAPVLDRLAHMETRFCLTLYPENHDLEKRICQSTREYAVNTAHVSSCAFTCHNAWW
jgi:hypothetical protein